MDFLSDFDEKLAEGHNYDLKFGNKVQRTGKLFSYTFWRTQVSGEVFWSVQGSNRDGSAWITTQYFGPPEEAKRYQQEVTMHHSSDKRMKMFYTASCTNGMNCIKISPDIVHHFKDKCNRFYFEYRLVKVKKRPYSQRKL